jgi:adenylosuccinate synthase
MAWQAHLSVVSRSMPGSATSFCYAFWPYAVHDQTLVQGGANAGHTIYDDAGNRYALHLVPSGILNPGATCVIGNGVVLHLPGLADEIAGLKAKGVQVDGRLLISDRAHLLFDLHKVLAR